MSARVDEKCRFQRLKCDAMHFFVTSNTYIKACVSHEIRAHIIKLTGCIIIKAFQVNS